LFERTILQRAHRLGSKNRGKAEFLVRRADRCFVRMRWSSPRASQVVATPCVQERV
jgi:hypothetical protein